MRRYRQPRFYNDGETWIEVDTGSGHARFSIDLIGAVSLAFQLMEFIRNAHSRRAIPESERVRPDESP
jgi:hypothetical protein